MARALVRFEWLTGLHRSSFRNLRLLGSWDSDGRYSDRWTGLVMTPFTAEDGCPAWFAEVGLDDAQLGWQFHWGVVADGPLLTNEWAIPTEIADPNSKAQHRSFALAKSGQVERYHLTHCRRLGANKRFEAGAAAPSIEFSVWAPNARKVEVVIGDPRSGYIASDGTGVQRSFAMSRDAVGVWRSDRAPALASFAAFDHAPYMYRIERDDGSTKYRTDLYSRCQLGSGRTDPEADPPPKPPWNGTREDLKGTKSCSVVIDAERVTAALDEGVFPPTQWLTDEAFWANEYDSFRPVPDRLEELVIYEMHVEGLGAGRPLPGTFADAIGLLDHLAELGVNAVELLPTAEAESWTWGYGSSHHFATEYAGGGRDELKHFVRACHQRGIVVIIDVVYNHFVADGERAEWLYDTTAPDRNMYYWYEGKPGDYSFAEGGYLDNGSTGYTPNFRDEMVRKMLASSAAALLSEFHIDGFRVDLTQAIHRDNVLHADGRPCPQANLFGVKFLREWVRTLRLIKPGVILTAEDHTGWGAISQPQNTGGIGFDAAWWAEWYHDLVGDSQNDSSNARLIFTAGRGGDEPLAMTHFADALRGAAQRVVYHESHDQAGNATYDVGGTTMSSARTIQVAVNGHLDGNRSWAEARCRVAAGLTILSPGVPMFFMGEEVGAQEPYRYSDWIQHREDFLALKRGPGARLYAYYRDLVDLRRRNDAIQSPNIAIVHVHDANRVIAFRRWLGADDFLVVASLNNAAFANGYWLASEAIADGSWIEVLNSDADVYGGANVCNPETRASSGGRIEVRIPTSGIAVFQRF